jgi:glucokinase
MSAPTVTNVVNDLLAADLIQPLGEGESSGGRPPDMISFKADRGRILAIQITSGYLSFLLTNLSGDELDSSQVSLSGKKTNPEAICRLIDSEAKRLLRKDRKTRKQLLALIVGVPGITNVSEGTVLSISTLDRWRNVSLRSLLAKIFDCLIVIENDTNCSAVGERYRGAAQNQQTFVLINIGTNVSAGIVLSGQLHHGAQWSAGEIAYLRLPNVSRRQPALHEFGELESLLTSSGILRSWNESIGKQGGRTGAAPRQISASEILDLAQTGHSGARQIILSLSRVVADILVNFSLILNPALIVLGGEIGSHPFLLDSIRKELELCEFAVPNVAAAMLGEKAVLWGAISVGLDEIPLVLLPRP